MAENQVCLETDSYRDLNTTPQTRALRDAKSALRPMNLVYGKVIGILVEDGMRMGRIKIDRGTQKAPLNLLTEAKCGDTAAPGFGLPHSSSFRDSELLGQPGDMALAVSISG